MGKLGKDQDLIFYYAETRSMEELVSMRDINFNVLNMPGYLERIVSGLIQKGEPQTAEEIIKLAKASYHLAQSAIDLLSPNNPFN